MEEGLSGRSRGDSMDSMEPLFFEGLHLKILCANIPGTLHPHWSYAVAIAHVCQLNNFLYQEFNARMAYIAQEVSELKQRFMHCSLCSDML